MAERIAEDKVNEIRQATEIVDVIGDYVQLKKQGRNYFGLCPFHGENSPSFSVSPDKQIYHCFGCGAGGNVFSFLMEIEGLSFQESAMKLAARAKIDLQLEGDPSGKSRRLPEGTKQMIEAHELLAKFYHHLLVNTKEGQEALEYLLERGFTMESIERFQIGYALPSWDFAVKLLEKRGFPTGLMLKAGIVIQREKDGTYFDRFRNRVMFPIIDNQGNTIAFSGRALGDDEPKYLNSPETQIFNKSKVLYNFHLARPSIRKQRHAVLFEGFADTISANRAGVENGIATMGTSLTEDHISFLKRHVDTVTLCYDSDNAGVEAAFRASSMLADAGLTVKVAIMPEGMDPDDFIKAFGGEKFRNDVIGSSATLMAFKLLYYRRGKNLQNEGDRLQYIEVVLKEISRLENAIEKDFYLRQLADEFSLSLDALVQQQKQFAQTGNRKNGDTMPQQSEKPMAFSRSADLKPAYYKAERCLIYHMARNSETAYKVQELLQGNTFNIDEHQAIITYLFAYYEKGNAPDPGAFLNELHDNKLRRVIADIEMMELNEELGEQELSDYIKQVLNYQKMLTIKEKTAEQKQAERQNDFLRAAQIAAEIIHLRKTL